jgi:hypothetical protein
MCKSQCRNPINMKKCDMTPPKFNNSTRTNTIDSEVDEISKNSIK